MSAFKVARVIPNAPALLVWLASAFALFALAPVPLRAGPPVNVPTTSGSGLTIRLSTPLTQLPHFGFIPVQASVENLSARDGEWDLQFLVGNGGSAEPLNITSRHTLALPAGQSREFWLYVPVARAGFATNGAGGSIGPAPIISKTPTGTKITRTTTSASGRVLMTMVTEINETTGELTNQNITSTGSVLSSNSNRPPAGMSVTYTIDPVRGFVSPRYRPNVGPFTVTVVTNSTGAPVPVTPVPPRVTITPGPNGTKVTRVLTGFRPTTEEFLFDTAAGTVRATRTMPDGSTSTSMRNIPATPGTETTYTINPTDGTYGTQTRLVPNSTAPAKMIVAVGTATPATTLAMGSGPSALPVGVPTGVPVLTTVVIEISGSGIAGLARVALPSAPATNPMRPFAVSASLDSVLRAVLASQVAGAPNLATVNVAQLPADWRLWSSFAGVILTVDEYDALDAARRSALRGWVGLGGQLFLIPAPGEPAEERRETVGAGRVVTLAVPARDTVGTTTRTSLTLYSAAALRSTFNLYVETVGLPDRETLFVKDTPLGDEIKLDANDASWVAVFLVIFAAIIGPVNLFLFAPVGRRHRLFWTTPGLALVGGLVLVGVIFFQDGTGGTGRRSTLVVLLPGQNQAAIFQEQAARTGFLPRRSFALEEDTLLVPLALGLDSLRFGRSQYAAGREAGQAGGDWFRNRAGLAHGLRRVSATRGRVEIAATAPDGAPVVESSLATVLREFLLVDATGRRWTTPELAPGRRVTLAAARSDAPLDFVALGGSPGLARAYAAATAPVPGRWSAKGGDIDIAPLATLGSLRWGESLIAYTGVADSTAKPAVNGGAR